MKSLFFKKLKNFEKKAAAVALAAIISVSPILGFAEGLPTSPQTGEEAVDVVKEVANHLGIYSRYDEISPGYLMQQGLINVLSENPELYTQVMKAMLESIDKYSEYYTPDEAETFMNNISGTVVGIGITFDMKPEGVNVVSVIRDTPAYNAGIKVGDIIVSADGVDLSGMGSEQAAAYIKGDENTTVTVGIKRGTSDETIYLTMIRQKIVGTSVESRIYKDVKTNEKAMYIKVYGFVSNTAECFENEINNARSQNIKKIIIDLRDNGGGIFDQAIDMADLLLPKGCIITTEEHKIEAFNHVYAAQKNKNTKKGNNEFETIVLINENSASASEVLTAALCENDAAFVIGKKSFGKGTIQNIANLPYGDCMKFTVGYYLTPKGNNVNEKGISPDLTVENTFVPFDISKYNKFTYTNVYDMGTTGDEVKNAKQLLNVWGLYNGEINDIYDKEMFDAVYKFQMSTGLYPYGVLDLTTQHQLYTRLEVSKVQIDDQLNTALEHLGITDITN